MPHVSVIVPVFNQSEALIKCLVALEHQTYDKARYEVVVVDNGSDVPARDSVVGLRQVCFASEPKPGSYCARNKGLRIARSEILAFTDADCVPASDWVERGVHAVQGLRGEGLVAGRIECTVESPERPTAVETYESILGFQQRLYLEQLGFSATANMFTTRRTLDRVGPFDEELKSGGDLEWGQRVRDLGLPQIYDEDVRVRHPARRSILELCRKNLRVAGGHHSVARKRGHVARSLLTQSRQELFPLRKIASNLSDERLSGVSKKLEFASLVWFVGALRTAERFRVQFGGLPRRT